MVILFCADPFSSTLPDALYAQEWAAAKSVGVEVALVDFEALLYENNPAKALRKVPQQPLPTLGIYRGWMLKPSQYQMLFEAILDKGLTLINDPGAYRHCHWLPEWYPALAETTPRSVWIEHKGAMDIDSIMTLLQPFGNKPLILKDYVKSRKHEWLEACFIPAANDRQGVERVVHRFLQLQGDDLNEGLVFREFIQFVPLAAHPRSGMPLTKEFRIFFLDGEPITVAPQWEEGSYDEAPPSLEPFRETAKKVQSRFFTMDVAQQEGGDWMVIELGDGQVAGLPDQADAAIFYQALSETRMARSFFAKAARGGRYTDYRQC